MFFLIVKIIPLLLIFYIAFIGADGLNTYLKEHITNTSNVNSSILESTTKSALVDTIKYLDKKSQESLEKSTLQIANKIADFLYERDNDLLFLSSLNLNDEILKNFYDRKFEKNVIKSPAYYYDDKTSSWETNQKYLKDTRVNYKSSIEDNNNEFNVIDPYKYKYIEMPLYKEITYFDLNGKEIYKYSKINPKKVNVFDKQNTYLKAEDFKKDIEKLNKNEIYVSDVIGEYVPSKIIGTFTKEKAKKANIEFEPEKHGYAGKENFLGRQFEGIVRFITPFYENNQKIGYLSLALDHFHIMEFTDSTDPVSKEMKQVIADASDGNYAFLWDYKSRCISHPRDYFIVGFDKNTGKRVIPWLSSDMAEKFEKSGKEINEFLEEYPEFENQSLEKKPNLKQITDDGNIALDCRFLNFAPQCKGWMEITENGGYGSFIIYWSKVWKLSTAAAIPYYTGKYADSKRGFGFVTIGANVDEFHEAANKTKDRIETIIEAQKHVLEENKEISQGIIKDYLNEIINELTITTIVMVIIVILIAFWMSSFISKKIENLLLGTKYFARGDFDYQIEVTSDDEIGELEKSFNAMIVRIKRLIEEQKELNSSLEKRVEEEVDKNIKREQQLFEKSKLASMGEMIGNIAHQWRQPLNVIRASVSGVELNLDFDMLDKDEMKRCIKNVNNQTIYLSKTIDNFRNFIKDDNYMSEVSIKEILEYVDSLMSATLNNNYITFNYQLDIDSRIYVNKNEIIEAFINIINNSKDVLLSKYNKDDEKIILIKSRSSCENCLEVSFYDNGGGIDEDIINRIFEPYFTTKHKSQGTGLGLSMVDKIIRERNGSEINVTNEEFEFNGQTYFGACFKIVFIIP